ncbi:MAG TPA: acylphosphatase [Acidimicrobiia bacterium]|nr:acylphosphatase [Acidimicrobiia bacterium]
MSERVRRRLVISGRVQGVFFRDRCRAEAHAHRVAGWVTNRPDGRVEAVLEGDPGAVATVEAWCRHGPPRAAVTHVAATDEAPTGATGFQVT